MYLGKKDTNSRFLIFIIGVSLLISCVRTSNNTKENGINTNRSIEEPPKSDRTTNGLSEIKNDERLDSLFLISPQGFILQHEENPSWESLYLFYGNGKLVNDGDLDYGNYYYRTGKWWLRNDSLYMVFEKLIFDRGVGKTIKVAPSCEFESGEKKEEYIMTIIDTTTTLTFFWPDFKKMAIDKDNWDWQLYGSIGSSQPYSKYDLKLNGTFPELSTRKVDSAYLIKLKEHNELSMARNEIFARYGYIFKNQELKKHFNSLDWYRPRYANVDSFLTEVEKWNIRKLLEMERN
jgi:hypothetical protein